MPKLEWEKEVSVGRYPMQRSSLFFNQWLIAASARRSALAPPSRGSSSTWSKSTSRMVRRWPTFFR